MGGLNKKTPAWIVLCAVCVIAVLALGGANRLAAGKIEDQQARLADASRLQALPGAEGFEPVETQESRYSLDNLYEGRDASGQTVGYVGQTTVSGYGGPVEVTAGVDPQGVITGVAVGGEAFAETPGLGALTREEAFTGQFAGKEPTITLNEGGVDTVSGASTTSRAVVSGVNNVARYIRTYTLGIDQEQTEVYTGATVSSKKQGFAGDVTATVGMAEDGSIEYLTIDTPSETDGLGKLASESAFTGQFIGKTGPFAYGEDGIEAVTGATFTSNAALEAINEIVSGGGSASAEPVSTTVKGFGGDVTVTARLNADNTVSALSIDTPDETDGLGKLCSESAFTDQFVGKAAPFAYGEDGIEAVTGATVTSTAVLDALNAIVPAGDKTAVTAEEQTEVESEEAEKIEAEAPEAEETGTEEADTEAEAVENEVEVEAPAVTDASRLMRPRSAFGIEATAAENEVEVEAPAETDASRLMRPRPTFGTEAIAAEPEVEAEAPAEADDSRLMRPRPAFEVEAIDENEVEAEAPAEADDSRLMRPRPAFEAEAITAEPEVEAEVPADTDASRLMRARPAFEAEVAVEPAAEIETDYSRFMRPRPAL